MTRLSITLGAMLLVLGSSSLLRAGRREGREVVCERTPSGDDAGRPASCHRDIPEGRRAVWIQPFARRSGVAANRRVSHETRRRPGAARLRTGRARLRRPAGSDDGTGAHRWFSAAGRSADRSRRQSWRRRHVGRWPRIARWQAHFLYRLERYGQSDAARSGHGNRSEPHGQQGLERRQRVQLDVLARRQAGGVWVAHVPAPDRGPPQRDPRDGLSAAPALRSRDVSTATTRSATSTRWTGRPTVAGSPCSRRGTIRPGRLPLRTCATDRSRS